MRRSPALPLLCLLALAPLAGAADADLIPANPPLPSSAMILSKTGQGSGFLIDHDERLLITNYHVTGAKGDVEVVFPVLEDGRARSSREYYLTKAPRVRGTVVHADQQLDLAAVRLQSVPRTAPALRLAPRSPQRGDRAHFIGNPGNNAQAWVYDAGTVDAISREAWDIKDGPRVVARTLEVKADGLQAPGSSGCPVVNSAGELIGVLSAGAERNRVLLCIDVTEVRYFLGAVHRRQGTDALAAGDYLKTISHCEKALSISADDPLTYNERGAAYSYLERYDDAIADYSRALRLDPKSSRALRNRGSAHFHKGRFDQAVADSTKAIDLDPEYASAYQVRARAYQKLGRVSDAQTDQAKAARLLEASKKK